MKRSIIGFTYYELVVAALVIGILAAIAYPAFQDYSRRAYYNEVVVATQSFKAAVVECYKTHKTLVGCSAGNFKIPANMTTVTGNVASVFVTDGVIVATPVSGKSFKSTDTYTLTPSVKNKELVWVTSGTAVKNGYVQ